MEAIKITLNDYILSGGGANGESYDHKTDPSVMLKLYFPGKIQQPLDEMKLAKKVYDMGISTPLILAPRATILRWRDNMQRNLHRCACSCMPPTLTRRSLKT